MNITEKIIENGMELMLDGKIDKITAPQVQSAILTAFQKCSNLTVNFSKVAYVSSAGLRALLMGQKTAASKGGTMKVTGVSEEVLSVFKLTGFDKVLTID